MIVFFSAALVAGPTSQYLWWVAEDTCFVAATLHSLLEPWPSPVQVPPQAHLGRQKNMGLILHLSPQIYSLIKQNALRLGHNWIETL